MKSERESQLRELLERSLQNDERRRSSAATGAPGIEPGDLFLFSMPDPPPVKWCVVLSHSEDPSLWFVVPGDEFSLVGTRDVAVPASAENGPLNLRCACGLWVHHDDFQLPNRIGRIDGDFVEQVRDHLTRMLHNDLPTAEFLVDTDTDPDYLDWMEELSAGVSEFEAQLLESDTGSATTFLVSSSASQNWYEAISGIESPTFALSAASRELDEQLTPPPTGLQIPIEGEGQLVALLYEKGVVLELFNRPETVELPTVIELGERSVTVAWRRQPSWVDTSLLRWSGEQVRLKIDGKDVVIQR